MAKIKTKQIGDENKDLDSSNSSSHHHSNSTDYQIAPVAAPDLLVGDTTLQNLAVIADADAGVAAPELILDPNSDPNYPRPVDTYPELVLNPNSDPFYPRPTDLPIVVGPPVIDPPTDPVITNIVLIGGDGDDVLIGSAGYDTLGGGAGNDQINGGDGNDLLIGGAGNDTLTGGDGANWLRGGSGSDTFNVVGADRILDWDSASDTLNVSAGSTAFVYAHFLSSDQENWVLEHGYEPPGSAAEWFVNPINISVENANNAGIIFINGDQLDDSLTGSAGMDVLDGSWGNDVLKGNAGNDHLNGGHGNDTLVGGAGDDLLNGLAGEDSLTGGEGKDTFILNATNQISDIYGVQTITDFVSGFDKILLDYSEFGSLLGSRIGALSADELVQGDGAIALDANDHLIFDTATRALYYDSDGNGAAEAVQFAILQGVTHLNIDDFTLPQPLPLCVLPNPVTILPMPINFAVPIDFVPGCLGVSVRLPPPGSELNWDIISLVGIDLAPIEIM